VFIDRADRIEIGHPLIAGALVALGHEMIGVVGGRILFRKTAKDDFVCVNRYADEARALLERARTHSTTPYLRSQGHHADHQQPR
jgi:hypothetical protein